MVLDEEEADFFSGKPHSPFMMYTHDVISSRIGAVTHVDNTARIQTVTEEQNPLIYRILKVWERKSGVGVILNTSFNLGGEVIVNDVPDALSTFRRSNITALYLLIEDRILIVKK